MCCYGKPWLRKAGRAVFVLVFAFGQTSEGVEPFFLDTPDAVWALNVVFSGDGTYLAANVTMPSKAEGERGSKEQLWIWDFATRTKVGVLQDPPAFEKLGIEQSIAFCPQAKRIAAARYAGRVVVWEALDSWSHTSFRELTGPVYSGDKPEKLRYTTGGSHGIAFSPDGRLLASAVSSDGRTVTIVRTDSGEKVGEFSVGRGVAGPLFTNGGKELMVGVTGTSRQFPEVQFWNISSLTRRASLRIAPPPGVNKPSPVYAVMSPDQRRLVATVGHLARHEVRVYDFQSDRWQTLASDPRIFGRPQFSADGRFLAQATALGAGPAAVLLWDFATGTRRRLDCHLAEKVTDVAFSPDGRYLVAALIPLFQTRGVPNVRTVCVWELPTPESPGELTR